MSPVAGLTSPACRLDYHHACEGTFLETTDPEDLEGERRTLECHCHCHDEEDDDGG